MNKLLSNKTSENSTINNIDVISVANYFINKGHLNPPFNITHLKIQKLVYYAQGWYSVITGNKLFRNKLEAWKYGPVSPDLYEKLKKYGKETIPNIMPDESIFNDSQKKILDSVWNVYGKYNSIELMERTHLEEPWLKNYDPSNPSKEIQFEDIKDYFNKL